MAAGFQPQRGLAAHHMSFGERKHRSDGEARDEDESSYPVAVRLLAVWLDGNGTLLQRRWPRLLIRNRGRGGWLQRRCIWRHLQR